MWQEIVSNEKAKKDEVINNSFKIVSKGYISSHEIQMQIFSNEL